MVAAAVAAALGMATGSLSLAQSTASSNASSTASGGDTDELQEVVVTAERRSNSAQSTPIAITAVTGDTLRDEHIATVNELQQIAPISIAYSGWHQQINIRGIGNSAISGAVNTGIAVIRDGLFEAETLGQNEPFYDIQDTEVLRGPQGTFVGYSSTGGAVLINSVQPSFDAVKGYAEGTIGDYSEKKLQGAINLPATDTLAVRIAFNVEHRNSFYTDTGSLLTPDSLPLTTPGSIDNKEMRVSVLWKPTDSFSALARVSYDYEQTGGLPSQVVQGTFTDPISGAVVHAPFYANSTHEPYVLNSDRTDAEFNTLKTTESLDLNYTLPDGILVRLLSGFEHIDTQLIQDIDATNLPAQWQDRTVGPDDNYHSEELTVVSPTTGRFTWIAGTTWFYRDTPINSETFNAGAPYSVANPQTSTGAIGSVQRILGTFGQVAYQIADAWQIEAGIRGNWDNNFNYGDTVTFNPLTKLSRTTPNVGYYHDGVPTGKIGVNYTPLPGEFFYAFAARGYKSGGTNNGVLNFAPEHVNDFELGWKGKLLDDHILTQVGGYYMSYQDYQYSIINPVNGQTNVTNLPDATIKGIEASAQARLGPVGIDVGLYYNDSKLGNLSAVAAYKLPSSLPANTPQCVGTQTANCFNYTPYIENVSGEQNAYSPKLTANIGVEYNIAVGASSDIVPRITYSHIDKQYGSIFQTDTFWLMPARNLVGADLMYKSGPWMLDLYGTNLTNDIYVSGFYGPSGTLTDAFYGAPRQFGLRFSRSF
jgi:iron complex outermembrane receptor protein